MLSCWMTFIQYADLNRNKLIVCTSDGALQGAAPPTFPLLDSVLSLFQLLIRYLGRGLDIKINAHVSEVRASILIRKCSTAGSVSSPRPPLPDRTTRGCTGGWGLPPRRCGILDQWPAFWTAGPVLDLLLLQQKTVLLCDNAQSAASLKQSSWEGNCCSVRQHRWECQDIFSALWGMSNSKCQPHKRASKYISLHH